jgi:dihydrofolate reductase
MSRLRVDCFSISLDGYGAGPSQSTKEPLGVGGEELHRWFIPTETFQKTLYGKERGKTGIDNDFAKRVAEKVGAYIMGRNMFGPIRGEWPDENWKGWWGDNPPYHCDVFVLTHHPKKSVAMEGGTTFHFVTGGISEALDKARAAANGKDIRVGGGVSTVRQYLEAGLIDEMHVAVSPIILGAGEHLLGGINLPALGYEQAEFVASPAAAHYVLRKRT